MRSIRRVSGMAYLSFRLSNCFAELLLAERDRRRHRLWRHSQRRHRSALRDREGLRVLVVIGFEIAVRRRRDDDLVAGDDEILDVPLLVAMAPGDLCHGLGDLGAAGQRIDDAAAEQAFLLQIDHLAFAQAVAGKDLAEPICVELAIRALESLVGGDPLGDHRVRDRQPEFGCLGIERCLLEQLREHLPVKPDGARLVGGDLDALLLAEHPHLTVEGPPIFLAGDLLVANAGQHVAGAPAEHVGDAPDAEAQREESDKDLRDPAPGRGAKGFHHGVSMSSNSIDGSGGKHLPRAVHIRYAHAVRRSMRSGLGWTEALSGRAEMAGPKALVAGNWKMNGLTPQLKEVRLLADMLKGVRLGCDVMVCPPATLIRPVVQLLGSSGSRWGTGLPVAAAAGAFTGDISPRCSRTPDVTAVIVGHSGAAHLGFARPMPSSAPRPRRPAGRALRHHLHRRDPGAARIGADARGRFRTACRLAAGGFGSADTVIAYEPVWAIGTGRTPTTGQVEEVHRQIRRDLIEMAGEERGSSVRILYGGSVKPDNAAELLAATMSTAPWWGVPASKPPISSASSRPMPEGSTRLQPPCIRATPLTPTEVLGITRACQPSC